jgi:NAD(P)-dependent dehydrogenase (short-subunit alcohol dehydrogenase family)
MGLLDGTVVVVSGLGPGLGRSIALQSARAGADVVVAARTASRLDEVAREAAAFGHRVLAVPADITDSESASALVEAALAEFGRVDTLVNNAFAIPPLTSLAESDLDTLRQAFETNVIGTLRVTRMFTKALAANRGSVVMINSAVLRHSRVGFGGYKMAKAALLALAQSLATELGPQGIRVNSVAPGYIWADSLKWYFGYLAGQRGVATEQVYDETAATTDLRELPEPDSVADAVVFLASGMARAITGQCLDVNAGEYHH